MDFYFYFLYLYLFQPCKSPRYETSKIQFFVKTVPLEDEEKRVKVYKYFEKENFIYTQLFAQFEGNIFFYVIELFVYSYSVF